MSKQYVFNQEYQAPEMELVLIAVEEGFNVSFDGSGIEDAMEDDYGSF